MPVLLAIDTSTEACSVALNNDGQVSENYALIPRQHADQVLSMVERLLADAGCSANSLDAIAFGRGPGSFTGLRIAAGVTQGLAFGLGIPVVPISTLSALAWQAGQRWGEGLVLSCLDARIGEVYWAAYKVDGESVLTLGDEHLTSPGELRLPSLPDIVTPTWAAMGNGWQLNEQMPDYPLTRFTRQDSEALPRASAIAVLAMADYRAGRVLDPADAAPVYLRDKVTN